jgi:rhodanese-related sulfurtransferase
MTKRSRTTVDQLLEEARARLERLSPSQARQAVERGALLIDIRSDSQRARDGLIPGARFIPRNVLEWRCDPNSEWSDPAVVAELDRQLIVICDEGYQSSLVAATLQRFGFEAATDVIGGFRAWSDAGLEVAAGD